jgi:PKD repeat protein
MGTGKSNRALQALLLLAMLGACKQAPDENGFVESVFKVLPESGLTTTRFEFDATQTLLRADENHPILIRYDWQNDGQWDQEYCTNSKIQHRFLKPGRYTIRMEARNMAGSRDTSFTSVVVEQGYSAPIPDLVILPDSANIYTTFLLNAAESFDDEDSADLLTYRWDFDGDGTWETGFASGSTIQYRYEMAGKFNVGVEVKDPTDRSSVLRKPITVDLLNDSILPYFTADGGFSTVTDIFQFDASGSKFLERDDMKLTYSWDIYNDNLWEAVDLPTPFFRRVIKQTGFVWVKLRVRDDRGLYMDTIRKFEIFPANTPPEPVLVLGNRFGNLQTEFFFHAYGTHDRQTSILDLKYQWDVNGDNQWEPEFDNLREIFYQYKQTGKYRVRLKVTDSHEDSSIASDTVIVYAGQHETGLLADKRNFIPDYYGIVRIGNLWWMQENLKIEIEKSDKSPGLERMCYGAEPDLCYQYGGLYHYYSSGSICPEGWRLPTRAEFQSMVNLEAPNSLAPLLLGGSSELHFMLTGYVDAELHSTGFGTITQFWLGSFGSNGSPFVWYFAPAKGENRAVLTSRTFGYSVRCVKPD